MNMHRTLTAALAAALLGAACLPAWAQSELALEDESAPRGQVGMHMGSPAARERMARELGLSEAQRTKMRDLGEAQLRRGIQERADLRIAELDLRDLVRADHPDQAAIDKQVDRIAGMRAQLAKERIATRLKMREVLTEEQRAKLRTMRATRGAGGGMGRGMRGGMRRGNHPMPDGGGPPVGE